MNGSADVVLPRTIGQRVSRSIEAESSEIAEVDVQQVLSSGSFLVAGELLSGSCAAGGQFVGDRSEPKKGKVLRDQMPEGGGDVRGIDVSASGAWLTYSLELRLVVMLMIVQAR